MKKILTLFLATLMVCTLAGCSKKDETPTDEGTGNEIVEVKDVVSKYTIVNSTGEKVTALHIYLAGSEDKGPNLLVEGMDDAMTLVLDESIYAELATVKSDSEKASDNFVLEFETESGYLGTFETLHREEATISLLSADAAAGATAISFITNVEETVTEAN